MPNGLILNSKRGKVILNDDISIRNYNKTNQILNAEGYKVDINTLTAISQEIVAQQFYEIPLADYVPVIVGQNSFTTDILTYKTGMVSGDFEAKTFETGQGSARQTETDADIDSVNLKVRNYRDGISWNIFELEQASRSGRWDLVTLKETARKTAWDLGVQRVAFLGMQSDSANYKGLLTQTDVNVNTTTITKYIKSMTEVELSAFVETVMQDYRTNCNQTVYPDTFVIPEADWNGLVSPSSDTFPIKTKLDLLLEAFKRVTMNPNFEIKPVAYADQAQNADVVGLNKNRYTLYKRRSATVRMEVPVDYTTTLQNTINGFEFQNTAYGQYTGVIFTRPKEGLYFDF